MIKNNYSGKIIVIDGLDGSGQSTQADLLRDFFIQKGFKVVLTKEPTIDSEAGKKIKEALGKKIKIEPLELQKLFCQDRKEHLDNLVIPSLKAGKIVISDRYFFSTFAYGVSDGLVLEDLIKLNNDFLMPDIIFILKVKPAVCISRIENRGMEKTLFEKEQKLAKVWETYEILPQKFENSVIVDGEKSIEEVQKSIEEIINKKFLS